MNNYSVELQPYCITYKTTDLFHIASTFYERTTFHQFMRHNNTSFSSLQVIFLTPSTHCCFMEYSGTPPFRTSEMRTSHFNCRFAPVWIAAIHYNPWMRTPRYSVKRTSSSVPIIHWIMWTLSCLWRKFVCYCWSIQQLDIIIALVHIVLASGQPFSQAYSKGEL